jgi:hypothetical protein
VEGGWDGYRGNSSCNLASGSSQETAHLNLHNLFCWESLFFGWINCYKTEFCWVFG